MALLYSSDTRHTPNFLKQVTIYPIETLVCNCWTNDYTLDQLDAGKSVQGSIECVTVYYLDYSKFSRPVYTYVVNFHS